jgi:hypothetical protein
MKRHLHSNGKFIRSSGLFALLFCVMVPLSTCSAEDVGSSVELNSKAVLFSFNGLSTLGAGAFNGGIGGKYYLLDVLALRASLQFLTASQTLVVAGMNTNGSSSATRFGLTAAAEYHLLKSRVSPYVGAGIDFSTTSTNHKNPYAAGGALTTQVTIKNSSTGEVLNANSYTAGATFGINGLGGIEFFITKELSLSAEYQLGYAYISQSDEVRTTTTTTGGITSEITTTTPYGSTSQFGITSVGLLTLAVYF